MSHESSPVVMVAVHSSVAPEWNSTVPVALPGSPTVARVALAVDAMVAEDPPSTVLVNDVGPVTVRSTVLVASDAS